MAKPDDQSLNIRVRLPLFERINPELLALFRDVPVSMHSTLCLALMERCIAYERHMDALKAHRLPVATSAFQSIQAVDSKQAAPEVPKVTKPSAPAVSKAQVEDADYDGGGLQAVGAKSLVGFNLT